VSQRFDCVPGVDAFEVYRALRIVNPSPYMYFLRFGLEDAAGKKSTSAKARRGAPGSTTPRSSVAHIVGSSPELLVRVHGREVEYRPIAGTRPRSADEVEDRAMEADLRANAEKRAETIWLYYLVR